MNNLCGHTRHREMAGPPDAQYATTLSTLPVDLVFEIAIHSPLHALRCVVRFDVQQVACVRLQRWLHHWERGEDRKALRVGDRVVVWGLPSNHVRGIRFATAAAQVHDGQRWKVRLLTPSEESSEYVHVPVRRMRRLQPWPNGPWTESVGRSATLASAVRARDAAAHATAAAVAAMHSDSSNAHLTALAIAAATTASTAAAAATASAAAVAPMATNDVHHAQQAEDLLLAALQMQRTVLEVRGGGSGRHESATRRAEADGRSTHADATSVLAQAASAAAEAATEAAAAASAAEAAAAATAASTLDAVDALIVAASTAATSASAADQVVSAVSALSHAPASAILAAEMAADALADVGAAGQALRARCSALASSGRAGGGVSTSSAQALDAAQAAAEVLLRAADAVPTRERLRGAKVRDAASAVPARPKEVADAAAADVAAAEEAAPAVPAEQVPHEVPTPSVQVFCWAVWEGACGGTQSEAGAQSEVGLPQGLAAVPSTITPPPSAPASPPSSPDVSPTAECQAERLAERPPASAASDASDASDASSPPARSPPARSPPARSLFHQLSLAERTAIARKADERLREHNLAAFLAFGFADEAAARESPPTPAMSEPGAVWLMYGVLTPSECVAARTALDAVAARGGWQTDRHREYPTTDLPLSAVGPALESRVREAIFERVCVPLAPFYCGEAFLAEHLELRECFFVKYSAADGEQRALTTHTDGSLFSFNVLLSDHDADFDGGGTTFEASGWTVRGPQGAAVAHGGDVRHGGCPIVRGERYLLVGFVLVRREYAYCVDECEVAAEDAFDKFGYSAWAHGAGGGALELPMRLSASSAEVHHLSRRATTPAEASTPQADVVAAANAEGDGRRRAAAIMLQAVQRGKVGRDRTSRWPGSSSSSLLI